MIAVIGRRTRPRPGSAPVRLRATRVLSLAVLAILSTVAALLVVLRGAPVVWLFDPRGDFSVFYNAAQAALHDRNLYAVYNYRYIPALAWLLRPLTLMGEDRAYVVWALLLTLCQAGALVLLARQYGRRVLIGALALSPALVLAIMVAQPTIFVMLALAGAMAALERDHVTLAGLLLAAAWLKPQIALPAACLFVVWRPRAAVGFAVGSMALLANPLLPAWLHSMRAFDVEHERVQSSLAGLWPGVFGPHHAGFFIMAAAALAGSILVQRRGWAPARTLAVLLLIWFIAAPYSHAYDVTLLIVPLAVLGVGPSALLIDCWIGSALSFYSLSTAALVAPLLLIGALAAGRCSKQQRTT